jgi:hypothetical protein
MVTGGLLSVAAAGTALGRPRFLGPVENEGRTTMSDDLAYAPATELAARIRRRDLSPGELIDAVIARVEARNPSLMALVFTAFDEARERAQHAERALTSGDALGRPARRPELGAPRRQACAYVPSPPSDTS